MIFETKTLQSATPMLRQKYNEDNAFQVRMMEEMDRKSFPFQVNRYLERLRDGFQKEYLDDNKYIDLNGETRTPKKGVTRGETEAA